MKQVLSLALQKITGRLDKFNDRFTSYRLVLYFLLALLGWAILGSLLKRHIQYNWHEILVSAIWLTAVSWSVNKLLARFLDIPANKESDLITALILTLILAPPATGRDFAVTAAAGLAAMASKYVIAIRKSHIFNPAAAGAFVAGELFHHYPSWWVGTKFIAPVLVIGGLLVLRKTKRFMMFGLFLLIFIAYQVFNNGSAGVNWHLVWLELISTQVLFFAIIMLTEPQTSPTIASRYLPYAALVGVLYSTTRLKLSPEEALLIGNLAAFAMMPNRRFALKFVRRVKEADGIYSYIFSRPPRLNFSPGQYMEWALAHNKTDSRGNRRFLTVSSSPTEKQLMFTVKHPSKASSFKQKLDELKPGDLILASHVAGSFSLPKDPAQPIAMLAGGVGITPFRSMVKYLVDNGEQRDAALLYSATSAGEIAFRDLFAQARQAGVKPYFITGSILDQAAIKKILPDYQQRKFYVSGPYGFVNAMDQNLLRLGIDSKNIITDYFPGYGG